MDRRFSQTLPHLDIDPILRDQILAAAIDSDGPEGTYTATVNSNKQH